MLTPVPFPFQTDTARYLPSDIGYNKIDFPRMVNLVVADVGGMPIRWQETKTRGETEMKTEENMDVMNELKMHERRYQAAIEQLDEWGMT